MMCDKMLTRNFDLSVVLAFSESVVQEEKNSAPESRKNFDQWQSKTKHSVLLKYLYPTFSPVLLCLIVHLLTHRPSDTSSNKTLAQTTNQNTKILY